MEISIIIPEQKYSYALFLIKLANNIKIFKFKFFNPPLTVKKCILFILYVSFTYY